MSLPVLSPDKGGRLVDQVSNLSTVKILLAQRTTLSLGTRTEYKVSTRQRKRKKRLKKQGILRLGTWNIKSWNSKNHEVLSEITEKKIDICAISEVKKKGKGTQYINEYILAYNGKPKNERAKCGVGILLHKKFEQHIDDIEYISDRLLKITLKIDNEYIHIYSVYAPDITKSREERRMFYEQLQNEIDKITPNQRLLLMGDFNARIGDDIVHGIKQRFHEQVNNDNGDLLVEFCAQNSLRINNTFFAHDFKYKYTFTNAQGQQSMIDYVITSRQFKPTEILDVRTLNSANIGSDHALVLCKIRLNITFRKRTNKEYTEKFNLESFQNDSTKDLYARRLEDKNSTQFINSTDSVEDAWKKVKSNITEAAEESIGKRKIKTGATNKNKTPWYTEEVKEITKNKRDAFLHYKETKRPEDWQSYQQERNLANQKIRELKESYWEKFTKEMESDMYGAQRKVWKMLRKQKAEVSETVKINVINSPQWKEYFETLYREEKEYTQAATITDEDAEINITEAEVEDVIKKIKNRKAPGLDGISNELLKYGNNCVTKELTKLFNKILDAGKIPEDWKGSITLPLFKKGDRKNPDNYRGITLLNTCQKLLSKIILNKLRIEISEEQQGFRINRSTTDATFIIRQIVEKAIEFNRPAFLCFVDLKKAFDRVKLNDVISMLIEREVPTKLIKIIEDMYVNTTTRIQTGNTFSEVIKCNSGIRQGDSLSPALFNLVMDKIISRVRNLTGYRMGNKNLTILCYADDAVLIADTEDNLQKLLHNFNITAKQYNMIVSTEKTKCMVISKEPVRCKLEVEGKIIQQVMSFKYLGIDISSDRNTYKEVQHQSIKGAQVSGFLRDTTWKNKYMNVDSKIKIYKTMIRPIMTYGAETRAETSRTKQLLRTVEMNTLRAIIGKTRLDRIRNSDVRQQCDIIDVTKFIKKRRRCWDEHVSRADSTRLIKIARDYRPSGRRSIGRPQKRWAQSWITSEEDTP